MYNIEEDFITEVGGNKTGRPFSIIYLRNELFLETFALFK